MVGDEVKDLAYIHLLLDEVIERYSLPVALVAIGNVEIKVTQVLRSLAEAGNDVEVGVKE